MTCACCPRKRRGLVFCPPCAVAFRKANVEGTHAALIEWTAARTLRMAKRFGTIPK